MSSYRNHPNYLTALRNKEYFNTLLTAPQEYQKWEWITTIIFYSALHYVKASLFVVFNYPDNKINDHLKIKIALSEQRKQKNISRKLHDHYNFLYDVSRIARYEYFSSFKEWDAERYISQVQDDYVRYFENIENEIMALLERKP